MKCRSWLIGLVVLACELGDKVALEDRAESGGGVSGIVRGKPNEESESVVSREVDRLTVSSRGGGGKRKACGPGVPDSDTENSEAESGEVGKAVDGGEASDGLVGCG